MLELNETINRIKSFWHFVRYNPPSLFRYWVAHMREPGEGFWMMMAWNSPYFEAWLKEGSDIEV